MTATALMTASLGGRSLELAPDRPLVQVGRDASCDLSINSIAVSRFHGRLSRHRHGEWLFQDQGSTNGSYVQGARIEAIQVTPGLVINLGGVHGDRLSFHFAGQAPPVNATPLMSAERPSAPFPAYPGHGNAQTAYAQPVQPPVVLVQEAAPTPAPNPSQSSAVIGGGLVASVMLLLGVLAFLAMDDSTSLDSATVQQNIESGIRAQSGIDVSVDCPAQMEGEQGEEFRCLVRSPYGRNFAVVRIESSQGAFTWDVR